MNDSTTIPTLEAEFRSFRTAFNSHAAVAVAHIKSSNNIREFSIIALRDALNPFADDRPAFDAVLSNMIRTLRSDVTLVAGMLPSASDRQPLLQLVTEMSAFASNDETSL